MTSPKVSETPFVPLMIMLQLTKVWMASSDKVINGPESCGVRKIVRKGDKILLASISSEKK